MSIEKEFNCLGYFGFGNGISAVRKKGAYCNACPMAKSCWEIHRARCKEMFPDACALIDKLASEPDGQKKIGEFIRKHKAEPYMSVMMGNLEDGMHVINTGKPKDRGELTLPYPFKPIGE